jgi:hypothetical protein
MKPSFFVPVTIPTMTTTPILWRGSGLTLAQFAEELKQFRRRRLAAELGEMSSRRGYG